MFVNLMFWYLFAALLMVFYVLFFFGFILFCFVLQHDNYYNYLACGIYYVNMFL